MPDYKFDTDLTVKPQGQMSLGDIVNVARGAQAYKQAEQINPLQLEQQQAITESAQTGAEFAKIGLNEKKMMGIANAQVSMINNPLVVKAEQDPNSIDKNELIKLVQENGRRQGRELGISSDQADKLNQPYVDLAANNPSALRQYFKERHLMGLDQASRATVLGNLGASTQPQNVAQPQGVQPNQMNAPVYSQPEKLPYPVRQAGTPYAQLPSEENDRTLGNQYKNSLVANQSNITTARENVRHVLKTAEELEKSNLPTSGVAGGIVRNVSTWLGDPTYKQLSKDLANVQIANIKATGGSMDTVGGQQLQRMANGDETYPPKVLMDIARRTDADLHNVDMQATAAQKFAERFGDQNMNAFKQMWTKNADSRVFQVISIAKDPDLSAEQKKAMTDKLLGNDPKQRKIFNEKYQNIRKLESTGSL